MMTLRARLRHHLVEAQAGDDHQGLRVLVDGNAHRAGLKFWKDYVSDKDFRKFPAFMQELDQMLIKFGAKPRGKAPDDVNEEDVDEGANPLY